MKKFLKPAAVFVLGLALAACGSRDAEEEVSGNTNGDLDFVWDLEPDGDWDFDWDYDFDIDFDFDLDFGWDPSEVLGNPAPELAALMNQLYTGVSDAPMVENWELTENNFESFLFIDYIPGSRGVVSQAMINVIPHAVVLLELPEGADVAAVAADIEASADPARWICVNAESLGVFHDGRFVVMAMSTTDTVRGIEANVPTVLN